MSDSFDHFSSKWLPRIDDQLEQYLVQCGEDCPEKLCEAMRYTLLAPGKRIRPFLALMTADACGGSVEKVLPVACAVEMVHAFSLIHDDLPTMDDDDMRRGKPSSHKVFGEGQAILAGDALLALAFDVLSRSIKPAEVAVECSATLSRAAGPSGMAGGQWDDLSGGELTLEKLESLHRRKTGALIEAALIMGAQVARASDEQHSVLKEYGSCIGLAFQITDDLLDCDCDLAPSFVTLLGGEESKKRVQELIEQACKCISSFGEKGAHLISLAEHILNRDR